MGGWGWTKSKPTVEPTHKGRFKRPKKMSVYVEKKMSSLGTPFSWHMQAFFQHMRAAYARKIRLFEAVLRGPCRTVSEQGASGPQNRYLRTCAIGATGPAVGRTLHKRGVTTRKDAENVAALELAIHAIRAVLPSLFTSSRTNSSPITSYRRTVPVGPNDDPPR